MPDTEGEGSRKLSIVMRGDHFNEITFKDGDRLNFTVLAQNPPTPPPPPPSFTSFSPIFLLACWAEKRETLTAKDVFRIHREQIKLNFIHQGVAYRLLKIAFCLAAV